MQLFASQLRTQGFALVESGASLLVLPEAEAKLRAQSVQAAQKPTGAGVQTHIFRLLHENAANLVPTLRPLISPNNTINVDTHNNALVVTDYADNLQRIGRIIASLDVSNATGVEVIALRHAVASDLAPLVLSLAEGSGNPGTPLPASNGNGAGNLLNASATGASGNAFPTTLIPEPRSNSIIVRTANAAKMAQIKRIIQQLDIPPSASGKGANADRKSVV